MALPGEVYPVPRLREQARPEPRGASMPEYRAPSNDVGAAADRGARVSVKYPDVRQHDAPAAAPIVSEKFQRYESNGETTLGDTLADVFTFSGKPDTITLTARLFGAFVRLTDRLNQETSDIFCPVNTPVETAISREKVAARNAVAGSNASLNAVGKWARREESR